MTETISRPRNASCDNAARPASPFPAYLTPQQIAEALQVDERTVLRWASEDTSMPATRIGRTIRFERSALLRWLERKQPRGARETAQASMPGAAPAA